MDDLSPTSYAILALLAVRSWTTYELAKQMERSVRDYWPRAQSVVYEEPKRLVARGLATAERGRTGQRPRTVYAITAKGRRALRRWLDRPGGGPVVEFEALMQIAFGDLGSKDALLATLASVRAHAECEQRRVEERIAEYRSTGGPFPERLHVASLVGKLLQEQSALLAEWARWAEREVGAWSGVGPGQSRPALDALRRPWVRQASSPRRPSSSSAAE